MADKVIDSPVLNRPYDEPTRHFAFDDEGIPDRVEESRRPSSKFLPVPWPRKGNCQLELAELTVDQVRLNVVARWRHACYPEPLPFPLPKSGKIAIKVINRHVDEVLKVFEVES